MTRHLVALRRWLLLAVALLSIVLVALVLHERKQARRLIGELPKRLGFDIRSETNGYTYTQSVKGRKLFTVHAAKAIQRENGKTNLHDVSIVVYGAPGSNRTDSIRGDEFEYDQANGVVRALGEAHLDLAAPATPATRVSSDAPRIVVTTRGLIFLQKLGVAATDEPLEFAYGAMRGSAHGAEYEMDTGTLHLRHDVVMDGEHNGRLLHVAASTAELERTSLQVTLQLARLQAGTQQTSADHVVALLTKDGAIRDLHAGGHVVIDSPDGQELRADHVHATFSATGQLQQAVAQGDVRLQDTRYTATSGLASMHFDAKGHPLTAELTQSVRMSLAGSGKQDQREMQAPHAVLNLVTADRHTQLHDMTADGGALLRSVQTRARQSSPGVQKSPRAPVTVTTLVSATVLHASTDTVEGKRFVSAVEGHGETRIDQSDSLGSRSVSSADTLVATLAPPTARSGGSEEQSVLRALVQSGHVRLTRHVVSAQTAFGAGTATHQEDDSATAQRGEWDSDKEQLRLSGSPILVTPDVQLAADVIVLEHLSSMANVTGNVRGTFLQSGTATAEPVHVVADRGSMDSKAGRGVFDGGLRPVHLWTSTASLVAAHVDLDRSKGTLVAHSSPGSTLADVQLTLFTQGSRSSPKPKDKEPLFMTGRDIFLTSASEQAPAHINAVGTVRLSSVGTDLHADRVLTVLNSSPKSGTGLPGTGLPGDQPAGVSAILGTGSSIRSILATGDVHVQQPGRSATGESLLYTAKDDLYRLNGTHDKPSLLHDSLQGDVTGSVLLFHGSDSRAEVAAESSRRVHTEVPAPVNRRP